MNKNVKHFYDDHKNFADRRVSEYFLSPGIRCKFDLLKKNVDKKRNFKIGVDLGSSGNSILYYLDNIKNKSFLDLAHIPLHQYRSKSFFHPICGDLTKLPYRDDSFDFVSALDVLEHVKDDKLAISEISRILIKNGLVIITVPHSMKYYTKQDKLIGHYRRYEIKQLISTFMKFNLQNLKIFSVYGQLMRFADIQSIDPEMIEERLSNLRNKYETKIVFRHLWRCFVWIGSKAMKLDAKHQPLKKGMNIALIFKKQ